MRPHERGTTVLEAVVTFAIVSLALVAFYEALAGIYRNAARLRLREEALLIGRSQLDSVSRLQRLEPRGLSGQLSQGGSWTVKADKLTSAQVSRPVEPLAIVYEARDVSGGLLARLKTFIVTSGR